MDHNNTASIPNNYKKTETTLLPIPDQSFTASLTVSAAARGFGLRLLSVLCLRGAALYRPLALIRHFARIIMDDLHLIPAFHILLILTIRILIIQLFVLKNIIRLVLFP